MQVYYDKDADLSIIQRMDVVWWAMARKATPTPTTCATPAWT